MQSFTECFDHVYDTSVCPQQTILRSCPTTFAILFLPTFCKYQLLQTVQENLSIHHCFQFRCQNVIKTFYVRQTFQNAAYSGTQFNILIAAHIIKMY